jgi:hypothetical protein
MTPNPRLWGMSMAVVVALAFTLAACGGSNGPSSSASSVRVEIAAPPNGAVVRGDRITVRGTVTPPNAVVEVKGQGAQVGNGVFATSVSLHPGRNSVDVVASARDAAPTTVTIVVTRQAHGGGGGGGGATPTSASSPGLPPLAGPTNCGGGLTAGAHTSCPFAENVRTAYNRTGSGVVDVYSPATGQTYRMYCTGGQAHICTGANNASVYFGDTVTYAVGNCGGGLSAGPNTTCGFAQNVRASYERTGDTVLAVSSPSTGQTYTMYCTSTSPHTCTGGNNAAVYFP